MRNSVQLPGILSVREQRLAEVYRSMDVKSSIRLVKLLGLLGRFAVSICVVALLTSVTVVAAPPPEVGLPVKVVNTPTVNIGNSPTITLGNTPNVTIANTPSVNIANTPVSVTGNVSLSTSSALPVVNELNSGNPIPLVTTPGAIEAYQSTCNIGILLTCNFTAVPTGKLLVVKEFDFDGVGTSFSQLQLVTAIGGNPSVFHDFVGASMASHFAAHQGTTIYADSTGSPLCSISAGGITTATCNISGYLVNTQ